VNRKAMLSREAGATAVLIDGEDRVSSPPLAYELRRPTAARVALANQGRRGQS
jgi:hypothetical protein